MATYRCAICGSANVTKQESNSGFSYKKALVGTAVFGTIGTVAGINGKNKTAYVCTDCGSEMPYPMDRATMDMIDIVMTAPQYLAKTLPPSILEQYFNVKKEITMYLEASDNAFISASSKIPSNPAKIQESEFRAAVLDCGNFSGYHSALKEGPLSKERYAGLIQAIKSSHTVFYGILAYPHLINPKAELEDDGLYFRPYYLMYSVLYYVLSVNGPMTARELFSYVHSDKITKKVFDMVMEDTLRKHWGRYQNMIPRYKTITLSSLPENEYAYFWLDALYRQLNHMPREPIFYNCRHSSSFRLDSEEQLYVGIKLRDDYLYIKNTVSEEDYLLENHPEWFAKFKENRNKYNEITASLSIPSKYDDSALNASINALKNENRKANESIDKLRKKIFGKKKALEEIEVLNQTIAVNSRKIREQEALLEKLKLTHTQQQFEAKTNAEAKQKALNKEYDLLLKEKKTLLENYPDWIEVKVSD